MDDSTGLHAGEGECMRDLVIIGAGGFGRETVDVVRALGEDCAWQLLGVVDDSPSVANLAKLKAMGVTFLGPVSALPDGVDVVVAVGDPLNRREIVARVSPTHGFASLIHPSTVWGRELVHGPGLVVLGGVCVGSGVTLGAHVHLNAHAVIGHDARLEDHVSVNPNATVSGNVVVGEGTLIGAASVVLQGLTIAERSVVGAAACVVRDVDTPSTVIGVPAVARASRDAGRARS